MLELGQFVPNPYILDELPQNMTFGIFIANQDESDIPDEKDES